jgi:hypothetical protein
MTYQLERERLLGKVWEAINGSPACAQYEPALLELVIRECDMAYEQGKKDGLAEADATLACDEAEANMNEHLAGEIEREAQIEVLEQLYKQRFKFSAMNGFENLEAEFVTANDICKKLKELKHD